MGPYIVHSFDNNKTVHVTINDEITPLSTAVVKRIPPDEESTDPIIESQDYPNENTDQNSTDPDDDPAINFIVEKASKSFLSSTPGSQEIS